jgi:hypothetical protein
MPVQKFSTALEAETAAAAERREAGLCAVAEWEAEHGALTEGELAEADRFLAGKRRRRDS